MRGETRLRGRHVLPGSQSFKDVRHQLYREYLRIIAVHQPSVFVMENVKGILSAKVPSSRGAQALMFDRIRARPHRPMGIAGR